VEVQAESLYEAGIPAPPVFRADRNSISAMLERMRDPGTYQAFQHFIANAPWSVDAVWRHLRDTIPDRAGVLTREDAFPSSDAPVPAKNPYLLATLNLPTVTGRLWSR
jgi:hypothetical protein